MKDTNFASPADRNSCPAASSAAEAVDEAKSKIAALDPQILSLERRIAEAKKEASSYFNFFKSKKDDKKDNEGGKDDDDKDKKKEKDSSSSKSKDKKNHWEKDQQLLDKLVEAKQKLQTTVNAPSRIFQLSKSYYIMRLNKHRAAKMGVEENKKVDVLIKQMLELPKVPKDIPKKDLGKEVKKDLGDGSNDDDSNNGP